MRTELEQLVAKLTATLDELPPAARRLVDDRVAIMKKSIEGPLGPITCIAVALIIPDVIARLEQIDQTHTPPHDPTGVLQA